MVWHRKEGQNPDEVLQNRFTAYLLSTVHRRRAAYIDAAMKEQCLVLMRYIDLFNMSD